MGNMHGSCAALRAAEVQVGKSSCSAISNQQHNYITVVDVAGGGRVVEVEVPASAAEYNNGASSAPSADCMKVGELLLEFSPGHFVAHYPRSSFPFHTAAGNPATPRLHERASGLGADADAIAGAAHVYVLFPMPRLHTRLTPQEHLTIALLLQNHAAISNSPEQLLRHEGINDLVKSPMALRLLRHSRAKRVRMSWGRFGAARVAPHEDIQQELINTTSTTVKAMAKADEGGTHINSADQEDEGITLELQGPQVYTHLMPKLTVMIKAKPWAPKLETICE
ncbi:hypothetical protein GOP47_0030366 [Adiantum capillus-veneris]|nr:hypothetical protein GOP47_0030366 [Adiantum capillus-veneris]